MDTTCDSSLRLQCMTNSLTVPPTRRVQWTDPLTRFNGSTGGSNLESSMDWPTQKVQWFYFWLQLGEFNGLIHSEGSMVLPTWLLLVLPVCVSTLLSSQPTVLPPIKPLLSYKAESTPPKGALLSKSWPLYFSSNVANGIRVLAVAETLRFNLVSLDFI